VRLGRLGVLLFCACLAIAASAAATERPSVATGTLQAPPTIDGEISNSEWSGASVIDGQLIQFEPERGQPSPYRTVIRIGQTGSALYVAIEAFDPDASRLAAAVTRRDGDLDADDSLGIMLDTFLDERTAYVFRTNALATQWDARIANNGRTVDPLWDAAWTCASQRFDDRWTVEFEIPFAILRFQPGDDQGWGLSVMRTVPRRLETSLWGGPTESEWRVSSFGALTALDLPGRKDREEKSWQAIPYGLAAVNDAGDYDLEIGGDLRWRPSSALAVDLTVNPDFALIEADVEEINLTRFELFVPEKRPFFLEGNEMYSQRIRQFYSRRIGDITWGGKAIGTVGGTDFSAIATSENIEVEGESSSIRADYGVARVQQSLSRGSTIGLLAANRRVGGEDQGSVGLDTTLFFTETLGLTAQLLRVHGPTADGGLAWFLRPAFDSATTHFHVRYTNLDQDIREDFNAVGFLRDDDRKEFDTNFTHTFWFEQGKVEKVKADTNYNRYTSQEGVLRSWDLNAEVKMVLRSGWEFEVEYTDEFELFEKEFRNDLTEFKAGWDGRDGRSIYAFVGTGVNFDSDLKLYGAEAAWAFGDSFRLEYSLTRLELDPDPEGDTTWIHVLETIYSFNPDLFIKLFLQTNSAIDKLNVQAVWVWRFIPPFGSLQVAYQRGTSEIGEVSEQGNTLFTKLSWVF
jgi:hypothetical protein